MKKAANLFVTFGLPLILIGISITFYFQKYESIATYLIVLMAGVASGIAIAQGVLRLMGKLK